jgi:hypothetical protein
MHGLEIMTLGLQYLTHWYGTINHADSKFINKRVVKWK